MSKKTTLKEKILGYTIILVFWIGMVALISWLGNKVTGGGLYAPRCWEQQDQTGTRASNGHTAVKQFPFDCKEFRDK